jgi:DNA (cytosine-5)-methyltransferase 1
LFSTDEEVQIKKEDLVRVCYVFPHRSLGDSVDFVMSQFPDHFYVKYHFPTLEPRSWNDRRPVNLDLSVCFECLDKKLEEVKSMRKFLSDARQQPLRALDLFGGVGAFGLAMEEAGWMKVTHAIEIAPSAAKTFKYLPLLIFYSIF